MRARAKGGCGLIVLQSTTRLHRAIPSKDDEPGSPEVLKTKLSKMADALHEHGTKCLMQLGHQGCERGSTKSLHPLWGFTELPSPSTQEVCHEMDEDEIQEVIQAFATYARYAKEGGLDGVEIHATHGYMMQQSWSPYANQRTDRWGQDRFTFAREVINRVREEVGKDRIVGVRISSDDWWPGAGGMTNEEMKEIARKLEATGQVDYISCSEGSLRRHYSLSIANMYFPPAPWIPLASSIRQAVQKTPVIAACRINDPLLAEKILADGHADLIGLVRALLCDPEFPNKAREGRLDDIRQCIACNQGCIDRHHAGVQISCLQNVTVGREWQIGTEVGRAQKKKKVLVIGGGPAGMEFARVAALRGHNVTLLEKEKELGGQINIITKVPCREEFSNVTRYLEREIQKLGVQVRLGTEASEDTVKRENADAVILATGAKPFVPDLPGVSQENVVTVWDVLQGRGVVGERVVIIDNTGMQEACMTAEFLADQGKQVQIVTPFPTVGALLGASNQPVVLSRLEARGIVFTPSAKLRKISDHAITISSAYSTKEWDIENVDTVVMATGYRADNSLYKALKGKLGELYAVGDCVAPRRALDAIREGYDTARTL